MAELPCRHPPHRRNCFAPASTRRLFAGHAIANRQLDVVRLCHLFLNQMLRRVAQRFIVILSAVLLIAGLGFSSVQARAMQVQLMELGNAMAGGSAMSMPAKCPYCGKSGQAKGTTGCVATACTPLSATSPHDKAWCMAQFRLAHLRPPQSHLLTGHDSVPDPRPPRTSNIT